MKWFSSTEQQQHFLKLYCLVAGLSFLCTLFLPYVGEEAVYTLGAMEMLHYQQYITHTLLSQPYNRPPLLIWLIAGFTKLLGWNNVLIASRLVTVLATMLTGFILYLFTQRVFKNKHLSLMTLAIFFSGDLLFNRGWLAYADSCFALFVFSSICLLWLAVDEKRYRFLIYAVIAASGAFLTKALTVYVFYAVTALVLFWRHPNRKFLITPSCLLLHLLGLCLPVAWFIYINPPDKGMLSDILLTAGTPASMAQHIAHIALQPLRLLSLFVPASLVVIYLAIRKRIDYSSLPKQTFILLCCIVFINYLPYWIAIKGKDPRYILPLYPLISLLLAWLILASKTQGAKLVCYWLLITLLLKLVAGFWGFYYYHNHYRSNYELVAKDILSVSHGYPLYSRDVEFTGLSVASFIDIIRGEKYKPLKMAPANLSNGFVIAAEPHRPGDKIFKHYPVKRTDVYLLCKGSACSVKTH